MFPQNCFVIVEWGCHERGDSSKESFFRLWKKTFRSWQWISGVFLSNKRRLLEHWVGGCQSHVHEQDRVLQCVKLQGCIHIKFNPAGCRRRSLLCCHTRTPIIVEIGFFCWYVERPEQEHYYATRIWFSNTFLWSLENMQIGPFNIFQKWNAQSSPRLVPIFGNCWGLDSNYIESGGAYTRLLKNRDQKRLGIAFLTICSQ